MVVGFNHNIRYKGEVFHVQTEDSGRANPHIITLLYRGGTILGSIKTSYADILMAEQLELVVESIMKEQHKDMMRRLKNGDYDARIYGTAQGPDAAAQETTQAPAPAAAQQTTSAPAPAAAPKAAAPTGHPPTAVTAATPVTAATAATKTQAAQAATPTAAPKAASAAAAPATPQVLPATIKVAAAPPAAPTQAAPAAPAQLPGETAAAVRQASAAALATALSRQQPTSKETPASATGAAPASISKRSLDEVILDYLITGEE